MEKSEECGSLRVWWNSRKWKKAPTARTAMNHVKFVKDDAKGSVKIREDRSKRQTCKRLETTDGTTNASRSNNFGVVNLTDSGLDVEKVNAVDVVQEIVEITVDSGAARSVWPIRKTCRNNKGDEHGEVGCSKR